MEQFLSRFLPAFMPVAVTTILIGLNFFGLFGKGLRWQRRDRLTLWLMLATVAVVDASASLGSRDFVSVRTKMAVILLLVPTLALCFINLARTFYDVLRANARIRAARDGSHSPERSAHGTADA